MRYQGIGTKKEGEESQQTEEGRRKGRSMQLPADHKLLYAIAQ